ncbi:hypothetical protein OHT61_28670 [Streptomyces sp. NBC_00178]|uniref:hypothetical protein n=1 Tax=Streptomyces sp. NBC_00178 TaxID=2975672 RepID=UPI002E2D2E43|nr:hypothetical protein [Streptomyces sp. NBC_00178]
MNSDGLRPGKRVVATGATGNAGTSVVAAWQAVLASPRFSRRPAEDPSLTIAKADWDTVDLARADSADR